MVQERLMATEFFTSFRMCQFGIKEDNLQLTYTSKLGHPHKQAVFDTAKHYGIKLHTTN